MDSSLSFITIQQKYYHLIGRILGYAKLCNISIVFGLFVLGSSYPLEYLDLSIYLFIFTELIYLGISISLKNAQISLLQLTAIYNSQIAVANNIKQLTDISAFKDVIDEIENNRAYFSSLNGTYTLRLLRCIFFWYPNIENFVMEQYLGIRSLLSTCLVALRSQLDIQKSALESAKTEVEKNITGTPELLAVSEAQQMRLDRQIEQFQELQRVLVKV